jgi:hypothetical protein
MAERLLIEPRYSTPLDLDTTFNCFIAQTVLFEASLAFRLSGDERFLGPVRRLMTALADASGRRDRLPTEVHQGFVLVGVAVAAELGGDALDQALAHDVAAAMAGELCDAARAEPWGERMAKRDAWNHPAVAFAAVGSAGLLCRERSEAEGWTAEAVDRLTAFFRHGITDSGMTREGLGYAGFVFRNAAPFLLACRASGTFDYRSPQDNPYLERLRRVPRWYAMEVFPRGTWMQNLNDAHWNPRPPLGGFLPMFGALDPGLASWIYRRLVGDMGDASHGQEPGFQTSVLFESVLWPPVDVEEDVNVPDLLVDEDVGYVAERVRVGVTSGFSFNCGRFFGGIHDQSDNGSVTFFAHDVPLLIDSGAANDPVEGSRSSSFGHNMFVIDDRGQLPSGKGIGVSGRIVRAESSPGATVITADLRKSYNADGYNPVAHAVRHCVYGKRPFPYLLLVDDVARDAGAPATVEQLFHTPPVTDSSVGQSQIDLLVDFDGASSRLSLKQLGGAQADGPESVPNGTPPWREHPVWRFRRKGEHVVMATLLVPSDGSEAVQVEARLDERRGRVVVRWRRGVDSGVDILTCRLGTASPATLTRDRHRLSDRHMLIGSPQPRRRPIRRTLGRARRALAGMLPALSRAMHVPDRGRSRR